MRIAQIAPLFEAVPPKLYGGTERVVHWITEALVAQGHDVTLFASGDSVTSAKLDAVWPQALRLSPIADWVATYALLIEHVAQRAHEFDVLHFHIDYWPNSVFSRLGVPFVTTLHGRLDLHEFHMVYNKFPTVPIVSISNNQRRPVPNLGWAGTVYHGMPADLLTPQPSGADKYFAFLGRISPEKRVDRAIEIAGAAGTELRVAAKIDRADQEYFDREIKHLFTQPHVNYIGEINDAQKIGFLSDAKALLVPIDWEEPFGLVMIEAMACGTPVIAFRRGSVPEVIDHGVTGFIVDDMKGAIEAARNIDTIDRTGVRRRFDERFTNLRMANDYLAIYKKLIEAKK
ncbi:MAG: glycosyltransferase family 4 protein [Acetobacteraceae bacterium]|nr:glycosyltransferase family 4 protein [Acetobacteraceae bacterium]